MSAHIIGEKLVAPVPQALGAREFMIERLILVSSMLLSVEVHHRQYFRETIRENIYIKLVVKKRSNGT